jgi:hypothetical protein
MRIQVQCPIKDEQMELLTKAYALGIGIALYPVYISVDFPRKKLGHIRKVKMIRSVY